MNARAAGDFDYDAGGGRYAAARRTDPRIAALVHAALGPARSVLNVGAGAGSYEPGDRAVTAVEPSASMRAQRPAHLGPAIDATAEHLPFAARPSRAASSWCCRGSLPVTSWRPEQPHVGSVVKV